MISWWECCSCATRAFCWDSAFNWVSSGTFSYSRGGWGGGFSYGGWIPFCSDSGSSSGSGDESESELESSAGPSAPSECSPDLASRENLSVVQEAQVNQRQDSQKPRTVSPSKGNQTIKKTTPTNSTKTEKQVSKKKRTLKSLRDFPLQEIFPKWYRGNSSIVYSDKP